MSYEISLMSEIISNLATKLKEADIEIIETHHRNKIDSPSGTALMLADSINETLGNKLEYVYDRHDKKNLLLHLVFLLLFLYCHILVFYCYTLFYII